jgi:transcriptional regulator with XRE-family HTH domain
MEGRHVTSRLLRELRRRHVLTQRELAKLAGVPQPTIAAIESARREPSLSLLSRITESAGETLDVRLSPLDRHGIVAAASTIAGLLAGRLHPDRTKDVREDGALRVVLDLRDGLRRADAGEFHRRVEPAPNSTGDRRWDALLAAVVEDECARRSLAPPRWTNDPTRFAKPIWFLSKVRELHGWELANAPGAFVRHGVLAAEQELESV